MEQKSETILNNVSPIGEKCLIKKLKSDFMNTILFSSMKVLGPMADNKYQQIGSYAPDVMPGFTTTPLQGLSKLSKNVQYAAGCNDNACAKYNQSEIQKALNGTEVIFICLGTGKNSLLYEQKQVYEY